MTSLLNKKYSTPKALHHCRAFFSGLLKLTRTVAYNFEIGYTPNGKADWKKDGNGNKTDYRYDGVDRLDKTTYPDYSYESNTFDANSNLKTWRKRDGKTLTHHYDAINAKTSTAVPGEYTLNFDYDGLGRAKLSTRHNSSVGYTYDDLGRLKTTTANGRVLTYEYDGAGRRSKLKHPDSFYVNYAYDSTGALTSIKEKNNKVLASYGYDNYGRLTTVNRNGVSGAVSSMGYNNAGEVQNFDHANINNASFKYNPASQIVNRVVSNANFQMKIPTISQENYEVNNLNQYDSVGSQNISYDNTGNLTNFDGWVYNYNAHNRLTSAARFGQSLALTYDPTGRLESSSLNGSKTNFLYDGNELIGEYNSSGTLLNRYVHGIGTDDPLVWYIGSGTSNTRYLLADERGSIVAETNSTGATSRTHQYGPYGEPMNASTSRFRYTGQILLPGTELYYYKARVYHPKLGRFLQTDPIGYDDGMNWYAYVGNDPVNNVDPSGKWLMQAVGAVIGGYSTYQAAKKAGLTGGKLLGATAFGTVLGAFTGGKGGDKIVSSAISVLNKGINQTATKTAGQVLGATSSGAISGLTGEVTGNIAADKAPTIEGMKNATIDGAGNGLLGSSLGAPIAGKTGVAVGTAIVTTIQKSMQPETRPQTKCSVGADGSENCS
jgi:RHS repeat-associated protein